MNKELTAFIAGPSNSGKSNIWKYGKVTELYYQEYINSIANVLNENIATIGILPDYGVPLDIATAIKTMPEKRTKIIGYYPRYGNIPSLSDNSHVCDELVEIDGGWSAMNTQPSKNFNMMICIGLSAGVFTEIAHTKVHRIWDGKNIHILIDERTISSHINKELESDTNVSYFSSSKMLVKCISKIRRMI